MKYLMILIQSTLLILFSQTSRISIEFFSTFNSLHSHRSWCSEPLTTTHYCWIVGWTEKKNLLESQKCFSNFALHSFLKLPTWTAAMREFFSEKKTSRFRLNAENSFWTFPFFSWNLENIWKYLENEKNHHTTTLLILHFIVFLYKKVELVCSHQIIFLKTTIAYNIKIVAKLRHEKKYYQTS